MGGGRSAHFINLNSAGFREEDAFAGGTEKEFSSRLLLKNERTKIERLSDAAAFFNSFNLMPMRHRSNDQWDVMKNVNPHVCANCHGNGGGCCRIEPGYESLMFGLLPQEVERISLDTGMTVDQFTVRDTPRSDFVRELATWFPPQAEILRDGTRQRLMTRNGACVFLTDRGCSLDQEARPFYCRMYPFWIDRQGDLCLTRSNACLAQQDALTVYSVLRKLGVSQEELEELWSRYLEMIRDRKSA